MIANDHFTSAKELAEVDVYIDEPLSKHTSLGVGGPADVFAVPRTMDALCRVVKYVHEHQIPYFILGEGTNVVVRDGGIRGMVIQLGDNLAEVRRAGYNVIAQAGARIAMVCRKCCEWGLTGLEFSSGIPGSIGGALVMNAGAYEGDMSQVVEWVIAIDQNGVRHRFEAGDMDMSYRHSIFQTNGMVVAEASFLLAKGECHEVRRSTYGVVERRCGKQPVAQRSAGSVFKRPPGDFAGRLLEEIGAKGTRVGGAMISDKHANFIVNAENATAAEIIELIRVVRNRVHDRFGIWLDAEVLVVGEEK